MMGAMAVGGESGDNTDVGDIRLQKLMLVDGITGELLWSFPTHQILKPRR